MPPILDATKWRNSNYVNIGYLWIDNPPIIFQCQVNGAITFPIADIPYDNVTVGTYTDCWQHESVVFSSTPITNVGDADLGRGRLRLTPDGSKVYIGRSSQGTSDGTCNIADDSWISVIDQFRPFARIPFIADGIVTVNGIIPPATTQFRDFNLTYNVGINGSPQVNLGYGPGFGGNVDPNTDLLTVTFNSVGLFSKGYDSNIVSWAVNYGDGTIISGSIPNITLTFPVGRRHVHFTATDGNGNTQTRHILIVACKDGTAYEAIKEFDVSGHDLSLNGNQNTFSVRVRQSIPRSTYSDNMNVIFWKEEYYNGVQGSVNVIGSNGQTGCESVKFSGWHYTDENDTTAQPTGFINEVTLHCLDIGGWLDKLPGFPIEVNRMASPTSWYQQKNANIDKYTAEAILEYMSTARFITDFYDSNTGDMYGISRLGSGQQTLYASCQEFMDRAIAYEFSINEQGMIFCRPNQNLLTPNNRTNVNIITLTEDDIVSFKFLNDRFPKQYWNRGAYVVASTVDITSITTPQTSFWVAPGQAPGQGSQAIDYNEQLILAPAEGQARTALRYAEDNSDYGDFEITLTWPGDAGIDPAYGQWITINISSQFAAQRGIPFTNVRFRVMKISYAEQANPTGNATTVKVVGRIETSGTAAVDDTPPTSNVAAPPPGAPPSPPIQITGIGQIDHNGGTVLVRTDSRVALTNSWLGNTPRWFNQVGTGLFSGATSRIRLDPFGSFLTKTGVAVPVYMVTDNGLFYSNDITVIAPVWTLKKSFGSGRVFAQIKPSIHTAGVLYVGWCTNNFSSQITIYKLSNYGATTDWSLTIGSGSNGVFGMDIDNNGADEVIVGVRGYSVGNSSLVQILNGIDTELVGTRVPIGSNNSHFVQKPLFTPSGALNTSTGGSEYLIWTWSNANNNLYKSSDGGVSASVLLATGSSSDLNSVAYTDNSNVMAILDGGISLSTTQNSTTWVSHTTPSGTAALGFFPRLQGGSYGLYLSTASQILYSPDFGQTIIDKTGDYGTAVGGSGSFGDVIPLY